MSRRKVVTEITIETNQVLVIKRRHVTRSQCTEPASEAEFVRPDKVNALLNEGGNRRVIEASSSAADITDDPDSPLTIYRRPLRSAAMLAKRFLKCLSRGRNRGSETSRAKGQRSEGVDKS